MRSKFFKRVIGGLLVGLHASHALAGIINPNRVDPTTGRLMRPRNCFALLADDGGGGAGRMGFRGEVDHHKLVEDRLRQVHGALISAQTFGDPRPPFDDAMSLAQIHQRWNQLHEDGLKLGLIDLHPKTAPKKMPGSNFDKPTNRLRFSVTDMKVDPNFAFVYQLSRANYHRKVDEAKLYEIMNERFGTQLEHYRQTPPKELIEKFHSGDAANDKEHMRHAANQWIYEQVYKFYSRRIAIQEALDYYRDARHRDPLIARPELDAWINYSPEKFKQEMITVFVNQYGIDKRIARLLWDQPIPAEALSEPL